MNKRLAHSASFARLFTHSNEIWRKAIVMATILLSAACSTPYQSASWMGGHTEKSLGGNAWEVTFQGNANRDRTFVMNAAMYRAAEISQREGKDFFQVTLSSTEVTDRAYVNFTNLVSYKAHLVMKVLQTSKEGCPQGQSVVCKVYGTGESLAYYGKLIGVSPPK